MVQTSVLANSDTKNNCTPLSSITLNKSTVMAKQELTNLIKPYIGECINPDSLNKVISLISKAYIQKGFVGG